MTARTSAFALVSALVALAVSVNAQGKNLLFYGNSYSAYNGSVAEIVQRIATEAGHPSPTIVNRLVGGQNLNYHATNAGQVAAISGSLPAGQQWDFVVMQGQSLEATQTAGNPGQFRNRAVAITNNVRSHSPSAKSVLYQTWARAAGHFVYPATFAAPMSMHNEIRDNYRLAATDIRAQFGTDTARIAAVGDGVAMLSWQPPYYAPDLTHPAATMTLLASMCIYSAIYEQRVCDLAPTFGQGGSLATWLTSIGLGDDDWHEMAAIADRVAAPSMRPFPGSSDHLLLESGVLPGRIDACGQADITLGSPLILRMQSQNGAFDAAPGWLLANVFVNGIPPTPTPTWPELHIDTGSMLLLTSSSNLQGPRSYFLPVPLTLPGLSVLVQGMAWAPSSETGNNNFATTDAHVLRFQ